MRHLAILATLLAASLTAQSARYPDRTAVMIEQKSYPLLTLLQQTPAFATEPALQDLKRSHADDTAHGKNATAIAGLYKLSDNDIATGAEILVRLYAANPRLRTAIDHLLASGAYPQTSGTEALRAAWATDTAAVNHTIALYAEGAPPPYPAIDAMDFKPDSKEWFPIVRSAAAVVDGETSDHDAYFMPAVRFAMAMLRANDREDAAAFEPMDRLVATQTPGDTTGLNVAAITRAKVTVWSKYPYSAILVPGIGPDVDGQAISPLGQLHVALAAARYRAGKAPFIIVSGGSVHPAHTHFVEAIEMRRELITRFGIPAAAILIDPHARHTTTNFRNANRELVRYGFPLARPVLVVANEAQASNIANPKFADRNRKELGYVPWLTLKRLSKTDIEYTPNKQSTRVDALSPLDP